MDRKDNFSADALSEADRVAALNKIIHEFEALKSDGDSDLTHKRRKMLLSLWGELVLARKDPLVPTAPESHSAEPHAEIPPVSMDDTRTDAAQEDQHVEAHHEAVSLHEEGYSSEDGIHELEEVHSPSDHSEEDLLPESHAEEQQEDEGTAAESVSSEASVHVVEPEEEQLVQQTQPDNHEHLDLDHAEAIQEANIPDQTEDESSEPVDFLIAASEDKPETEFVIQDPHDQLKKADHSHVVIASPAEPVDAVMAKISDVQPQDETPLVKIKTIDADQSHLVNIVSINEDHASESVSSLVRMRLLKSCVLHDMVLPQGTVVSTNVADAEELIASGTAERLLIQIDDEDDD